MIPVKHDPTCERAMYPHATHIADRTSQRSVVCNCGASDRFRSHYAEGRAAALRDVLALIATQDAGWRWRIGPSACAEPVTVYVGHVWHTGNVRRVWPVLGSTVEDCLRNMVERIAAEEKEADSPLPG